MKKSLMVFMFSISLSAAYALNNQEVKLQGLINSKTEIVFSKIDFQKFEKLLMQNCSTASAWVETQLFGTIFLTCTTCSNNGDEAVLAADCLMDMIFVFQNQ